MYDSLEELNLFPSDTGITSEYLISHFDQTSMKYGLGILSELRKAGIASEIYPDESKIKKQLSYANRKGIPNAILIGSEEMESGLLTVKDLISGEESKISLDKLIENFRTSMFFIDKIN